MSELAPGTTFRPLPKLQPVKTARERRLEAAASVALKHLRLYQVPLTRDIQEQLQQALTSPE